MSESAPSVRRPLFLSVPTWDICDEELAEWSKFTSGKHLAAYAARGIIEGRIKGGQELFPEREGECEPAYIKEAVARNMSLLAERGMARKSDGKWYAIAPGRMEPSIRRAIAVLLARRPDLPPDLETALDSWKHTLDALEAGQKAIEPPAQPAKPARALTAA